MFSSQLAELHSEGASVRSLQDALQALEQDKVALEERAERLEKELAAAKNTLILPSGKLSGASFVHPFPCVGFNDPFYSCDPGDAAIDQLREDKETAENEVRRSDLGRPSRGLDSFILS